MAEQARRFGWLRRLGPWIVGVAILVVIATQVPFKQFGSAMKHGPHAKLAVVEVLITLIALGTDSLATWLGLVGLEIKWPFKKVAAVRGATYLLFMVNYALGQGGFGYYLYRAGTSAMRAVGSTLFLMGTNLAGLLVLAFGVSLVTGPSTTNAQMWWTLVGLIVAFGVYLVIIASRIRLLADREMLAPLFEAGLRGHAIAIAGRLPHVMVIIISYWIAMKVWGIDVPLGVALTLMPAVALAAVLPISPAGLGTTQAAMVFFFAKYAPGVTDDERTANLLAFGIVHFVYSVAAALLVGAACMLLARRAGLLERSPTPAPT